MYSSILKIILSLIIGLLIISFAKVFAQSPEIRLETTERIHFIVLIRDTGRMKRKFFPLKMIVPTLPKLLFEGENALKDKTPLNPALPVYRPEQDHLSVVFVGIYKDNEPKNPCKNNPALSALPEHLFQWQPVKQGQNQAAFTKSLRQWVNRRCRAYGHISSTVLAETTILPYVEEQLAKEGYGALQFSRTILVMLDNDAYYGTTIPSTELAELQNLENLRDIDKASRLADKVNSAFHIKTDSDWIFTINPYSKKFDRGNIAHGNTLRYRMAEIHALENEENQPLYQKTIQLDRVAISNQQIKLVRQDGTDIILGISPSERLFPEKLEFAFIDNKNHDWLIGQHKWPRSTVIDLEECIKSNQCQLQADGTIEVSFGAVLEEPHLTPDDLALTPGKIRFKIRSRYNAKGIYTHHYVDTDLRSIDVEPVKPLEIPKSFLLTKDILDNKTLAAEYDSTKDSPAGLTQEVARARLEEKRSILYLIAFAIFVISVLILLYIAWRLLYKFRYHRPFKPVLKWKAARRIDMDFNTQTGAKILVGTLTIDNEGRVPWFGRLMNNQDYPEKTVSLFLNYDSNQLGKNHGLILSQFNAIPFGFTETEKSVDSGGHKKKSIFSFVFRRSKSQPDAISEETFEQALSVGIKEKSHFLRGPAMLARQIKHRVSHHTPISIFLATDAIADFNAKKMVTATLDLTFSESKIPISVTLQWNHRKISTSLDFIFELTPEEPKPPKVIYQANTKPLDFQKGQTLQVGTFYFKSRATHSFAKPFTGYFDIRSYKNHQLLPGHPVRLAEGEEITVLPGETTSATVMVDCDGTIISNPEPRQDYTFELTGKFDPDSEYGPFSCFLHRDSTQADILLNIIQFNHIYRFHWEKDGEEFAQYPTFRRGPTDRVREEADGHLLEQGLLELQPLLVKFHQDTQAETIFEIEVGNTGSSGHGWVKATLNMALEVPFYLQDSLTFYPGYQREHLLQILKRDYEGSFFGSDTITIQEGEPLETFTFQINAGPMIKEIEGGRIGTNENGKPIIDSSISIKGTLDIEIQDAQGTHRQHQLTIKVPIGLEKLPHNNWLCIDFGTSAIVAAMNLKDNEPYFLPLQKVVDEHEPALNLEDDDPSNTERCTEFLPSQVVCDADLRQGDIQDETIRKGYPRYQPASLKPGDPDFIGLPATTVQIRDNPVRLIDSLKGWLAQPSETLALQDSVKFHRLDSHGHRMTNETGEPVVVERHQLPLNAVVESGLAALAEGYITAFPVFEKGGQIIMSHSNTFTAFHKQKLHEIAWRAFNQRLGIALPERIHFISESDAVAYHYCRQRMLAHQHQTGWERLFVYDFGAGTLDLSLVHIQWNQNGTYPETWQVENRLGVSVAGHYLDSLLVRLIDGLLRNPSILNPEVFEYCYPVVDEEGEGLQGDEEEQDEHCLAVYRLWQHIREVKHSTEWQYGQSFRVLIGNQGEGGGTDIIKYKEPFSTTELALENDLEDNESDEREELRFDGDIPKLEIEGEQIYLNIPSEMVHNYPPLKEFIDFVTEMVIEELLQGAGIVAQEVNTIVVSGRGALWPRLREYVWDKFPNSADKPALDQNQAKNAVVSGAIAWQALSDVQVLEPKYLPRLAILCEQDNLLTPEEDWDKGPIDLRSTNTFRLVQISHRHPAPETDLKSLHRYFYVFLDQFSRDTMWNDDPWLFVKKAERHGQIIIKLQNRKGQGYDFTSVGSVSQDYAKLPWPIGNILLEPEV
jgi:hypothetical protein